jgi:hypothetical protein
LICAIYTCYEYLLLSEHENLKRGVLRGATRREVIELKTSSFEIFQVSYYLYIRA